MHTMSFEELEGKYAAPIKYSLKTRAKRKVKKIIKKMLRVIGGQRVIQNMDYSLCFVFDCKENKKCQNTLERTVSVVKLELH